MKIKIVIAALCLVLTSLVFAGCTENEAPDGGGTSSTPCSHSYSDGVCVHCNAKDPSYTENGGAQGGENDGAGGNQENEEKPDDNPKPENPPADLDGSGELPFVPAN